MTTTTIQDHIYKAQDVVFEATSGVTQQWSQVLDGYTTDATDPTWSVLGNQGSRTGWLKLTVPYPMSVGIDYTEPFDGYHSVFTWDGITAPVELFSEAAGAHSFSTSSGSYLIGFSPSNAVNVTSVKSSSWDDVPDVTIAAPSNILEGDFLLAFMHLVGKDPASSVTSPTGWSEDALHDFAPRPSDNAVFRNYVFSKVAGAAEPVSYTFAIAPSTGYNLVVLRFRGIGGIASLNFTEMPSYSPPAGADGVMTTGYVNVTGTSSGALVADFFHSTWGPGAFSTAPSMTEQQDSTDYYVQQSVDTLHVTSPGTYGDYSSRHTPWFPEDLASAPAHGSFLLFLEGGSVRVKPEITITHTLTQKMLRLGAMTTTQVFTWSEPFVLGLFQNNCVEPFSVLADAVVVDSEELFDLYGNARIDSVEPYNLGETLMVSWDELFTIIDRSDAYIGTGSPASPKLGWRSH